MDEDEDDLKDPPTMVPLKPVASPIDISRVDLVRFATQVASNLTSGENGEGLVTGLVDTQDADGPQPKQQNEKENGTNEVGNGESLDPSTGEQVKEKCNANDKLVVCGEATAQAPPVVPLQR